MHHRPGASDSFAFPSESDPGHSFANPTAAALYAAAQAQKKTAVKRPRQVGMPKLILRRKLQARGGSRHTPTTRRQAPVKESESEEDLMSNTSKEEGEAGREAADALDMDFEGGELEAGEREGKPAARDVNSDDLEAMEHEGDQIEATEQYSTEQGESETEEDEEGSVESDLSLGTGAKRISKASRLSGKQSHSSSSGWEPSDDDSSDDSDPYPPSKQSIGIKGGTTFLRTQRAQRSAPSKHQQTEASQAQKDSAAILSALRAAPAPAPAESGQASKWDSSFAVFLSDTTAKTHTTRPGNQRQGEKNPASHALAPPIKPVKKEAPKQAQRARRGALKSSLDVIIPARAARDPGGGTVLVEMPPGLSMEGATGVVGRVTSGGQRSGLMLDLMGEFDTIEQQ